MNQKRNDFQIEIELLSNKLRLLNAKDFNVLTESKQC